MQAASVFVGSVQVSLKTGPDIRDITMELDRLLGESKIAEGTLNATAVGSTGSITSIEFESGVIEDLKRTINRLAPPGEEYAHEKAWHDGNGHSHVQAALMGPSIAVPVRGGRLRLGTWQQIVAVNHDNRPRTRTIEVTILGTTG